MKKIYMISQFFCFFGNQSQSVPRSANTTNNCSHTNSGNNILDCLLQHGQTTYHYDHAAIRS